jgi:plastocyanin
MKKIYLALLTTLFIFNVKTANALTASPTTTWNVNIFGFAYSPPVQTVTLGDVIVIQATATHPLAQVSAATWSANGTATLSTGWGTKTANHTLIATTTGTIYYVCTAHVASNQMKGTIVVVSPTGLTNNSFLNQTVVLFPSPTKSDINFTIAASFTDINIKLFGIDGKQIAAIASKNVEIGELVTHSISLPLLANGVYLVEISSGSEKMYKKVVISN